MDLELAGKGYHICRHKSEPLADMSEDKLRAVAAYFDYVLAGGDISLLPNPYRDEPPNWTYEFTEGANGD